MQVICTDGTRFACNGYELTKYGVKLLDEDRDTDDERYDSDPNAVGYVPHDRLWYIVPDGVRPNGPRRAPPVGADGPIHPNDEPGRGAPPVGQPPSNRPGPSR
jgi:hypothetical protein